MKNSRYPHIFKNIYQTTLNLTGPKNCMHFTSSKHKTVSFLVNSRTLFRPLVSIFRNQKPLQNKN